MSEPLNKLETFRLEEFQSLRKEIELYLAECRSQERYTLIALGAIWAWLISNRIHNGFLWFIPVVLTLSASIRMLAMLGHFNHLGDYIKSTETVFGTEGWEHKRKRWTLGASFVIGDIALLIISLVAWHHRACFAGLIPMGK